MPTIRQSLVAALTRAYPLYSGCGTFANSRPVRLLAGDSAELAWARVPGGFQVRAPLDDYVGRAVFYTGDLDRKITWVCSRIVRPGDTVLDVGANLGLVTMLLSSLVGEAGQVHAFEPNPRMHGLIAEAIERNRVRNVRLHRLALGAAADELQLFVPPDNAGTASLLPTAHGPGVETLTVPVRTLSSVAADLGLGPVRLMKIDVEGFEPQVLEGAREWLSSNAPDAIVFELNRPEGPLRDHPTISLLSGLGYGFLTIPRCLGRMRLKHFEPARDDNLACHDFIAFNKRGAGAEIAKLVRAS